MLIDHNTILNLVIGDSLSHTQSPFIHNQIYEFENINAVLLAKAHPCLKQLIEFIKAFSVRLTAVTMPYKEEIIPYLSKVSPEVQALKAANTVIFQDNELTGYNTDVDGIALALSTVNLVNKNILILGAGGAARALGYNLKDNAANKFWMNRTIERASQLANEFGGQSIDRVESLDKYNVIINTTPLGMYPHIMTTPLEGYAFHKGQTVFDMVYNPYQTRLLIQAAAEGANTISGIDMFIGQAIKQVELLIDRKLYSPQLFEKIKTSLQQNQNEHRHELHQN